MSLQSGELLTRFPVFSTADPELFRAIAIERYGAVCAELRPAADGGPAIGNALTLSEMTVGYSDCEARVRFPAADYARQQFALQGGGSALIGSCAWPIDARASVVTSPGRVATVSYGADFRQIYLRISREVLQRKLAALLGAPPGGALEFGAASSLADPKVTMLRDLVQFVCRELDLGERGLPALALAELQQAVVVAFLAANRHNYSDLLNRDAADTTPRHVQQAEEFIRANWDRAVLIEELAETTGVAARTLFKSFRKARGYSPHQFAKRVRLERARDMLRLREADTTVARVALACGFANLGHFARDYREAFGERPSDTLQAPRGIASAA
jgi:AraC-like DNA-binding protein